MLAHARRGIKPMANSENTHNNIICSDAYCFNCGNQSFISMQVINVPSFGNVFVSSSHCQHCGHFDTDIKELIDPKEFGIHCELKVRNKEDLNRTLVLQTSCSIAILEIELEEMPFQYPGCVITIEIFISRYINRFMKVITEKKTEFELCQKLHETIIKLQQMLQGNQKFTFLIDDPSGNSCIENTSFPNADPNLWILKYKRTRHEDSLLHLDVDSRKPIVISDEEDINNNKENDDSRVYKLPDVCRTCWKPICINLQKLYIPNFKEVLLTCSLCENCGSRSTDVISCAEICDFGVKYEVCVKNKNDLNRDVVKSDYCKVYIPDLDFEIPENIITGVYTTIGGFLQMVKKTFIEDSNILIGDSATEDRRFKVTEIGTKIDEYIQGTRHFTIIFDDLTGNSFVQDLMSPDPDPNLIFTKYQRTEEQNDFLCLKNEASSIE